MIKMYCDICGKELSDDCHDVVNIDFNSYAIEGAIFEDNREFNLCVSCANKVYDAIRAVVDQPRISHV